MGASLRGREELAARVQQALALPTKKEAEMVVDTVVAALEAINAPSRIVTQGHPQRNFSSSSNTDCGDSSGRKCPPGIAFPLTSEARSFQVSSTL